MEFNSDIPHSRAKCIIVNNIGNEIWNFPVINYKIHSLSYAIGVWKIKQLKQ